jgi:hypothetical protein
MTDKRVFLMPDAQRSINVNPTHVVRMLGGLVVLLVLAHVVGLLFRFVGGHPNVHGFVPLFDLYEENNIPTYYSSTLLLLCSCLIAIIAGFKKRQNDTFTGHWITLAIIFLYLSVDEASSIHEWLSPATKRIVDARGLLFYAWVIPGMILVVVFAAFYWRFVLNLPSKTRWAFCTAAILYLAGAIGMELLGGRHHERYGIDNISYSLLVMLEESLEMTGIVVFVYGLLDYMRANGYKILVCFRPVSD